MRTSQLEHPGEPACQNHTYIRAGMANLLVIAAALKDWRQVEVNARPSKLDAPANWRFIADDARFRLQSPYPTV